MDVHKCIRSLVLHTEAEIGVEGDPEFRALAGALMTWGLATDAMCASETSGTKNLIPAVRMGRFAQFSVKRDDSQGIMQRNSRLVGLGGCNDF